MIKFCKVINVGEPFTYTSKTSGKSYEMVELVLKGFDGRINIVRSFTHYNWNIDDVAVINFDFDKKRITDCVKYAI